MSGRTFDLSTISVLWRRELLLFVRQKSRIVGTVAQPLLFWLGIGAGLAPTFRPGSGTTHYMEYFYPGVVVLMLLMSSMSATMGVIEDRHQGFLQGVLAAPGSRAALVLGKCLGASTVGLAQAALLLLLAPWAGFAPGSIRYPALVLALGLTALTLTAIGFAVAWWLDSIQGYHVVMSVALFPAWVLSGAMFPAEGLHPVMRALVVSNPLTYAVAAVRGALGGAASGIAGNLAVVAAASVAAVILATWTCTRIPAAGGSPRRRRAAH